ncbi:gluconate 2-dehydrogenase subunit 3 family protein [Oceanicoccus sp. KOV_DT_Chl]|uniref:gluconate 2-dehydrogenase subunit 3 family protein n=1 Tax=Oceanicoccus sp. KOV_DT_Chl TaxID=1904639 RepID=UPI000C7A30B5|nr:gluconate 2-dehydrogenase subunit 3 family protein [Oceanicoccus sp. KOV_DT_Chl]
MNRRDLLKNAAILLGGLSSASVVNAMLSGVDGRVKIATPIFSSAQKSMTAVLAEMIIPRTDTPGAIDAGVPHFIELMVSDWYTTRERTIYIEGLQSLDAYCLAQFKQSFLSSTEDQQITALEDAEKQSEAYKPAKPENLMGNEEDEDKPFFTKLKELTVLGYYSSELGATKELNYDPMPMRYGDIELADVERQWSS